MFNSLNQAFDSLERKIVKERRKLIQKRRRASSRQALATPVSRPQIEAKLVLLPYYSAQPISLEEVPGRLEEGGNEAFLFKKEDSTGWAVIFRRQDGTIGLVDPEA
jgi:putative sigma-54 modulation protein